MVGTLGDSLGIVRDVGPAVAGADSRHLARRWPGDVTEPLAGEPGQPLGNSRLCRPYERFVGNLGLVQHGFRSSWKLVDAERLFGLKEERVDVSRANVLGGVLLRLPPHDRVGREIEVGGLP